MASLTDLVRDLLQGSGQYDYIDVEIAVRKDDIGRSRLIQGRYQG